MAKNLSTHSKEVVRDAYTERVLDVCYELVKRKALRSKSDFTKALGFNHLSQYNAIEKREANFPAKKAALAEAQLLDKFGVNPSYLKGTSEQKFIREPEPIKMAAGEGAVRMNFRDKREKEALLQELEAKDAEIEKLKAELAKLKEQAAKPKSDTKPDTKSKK